MADIGERPGQASIETTRAESGEATVRLAGEIDSGNVAELDQAVDALIDESTRAIVFDIGGLRFIDSAGLAALVRTAAAVEAISIRNASLIVRRTIEATALAETLGLER
ncbi:MAG: STAS domain-containing protein [Solirubrobacteraceae bacterium]